MIHLQESPPCFSIWWLPYLFLQKECSIVDAYLRWALPVLPIGKLCGMALDCASASLGICSACWAFSYPALAYYTAATRVPVIPHLPAHPTWGGLRQGIISRTSALAMVQGLTSGLATDTSCGSQGFWEAAARCPVLCCMLPVSLDVSVEQNQIQHWHYLVISWPILMCWLNRAHFFITSINKYSDFLLLKAVVMTISFLRNIQEKAFNLGCCGNGEYLLGKKMSSRCPWGVSLSLLAFSVRGPVKCFPLRKEQCLFSVDSRLSCSQRQTDVDRDGWFSIAFERLNVWKFC